MKLQLLPAKQGLLWVRLGIRTFWRQPLAMTGQFFLFMGLLSLCSLIPFIGSFIGLALLPMASLGLMAATREAHVGNFPMPHLLWLGLRSGAETRRNMAVLGGLYAVGFCAVLALAALSDGGQFAKLYLFGGSMDIETLMQSDVQSAMWLSTLLYMPLSLLFWHAPALTHWYAVPPLKSLFFSAVACWRNWRAYVVFILGWASVAMFFSLIVTLVAVATDSVDTAKLLLMPMMLLMAAMLLCSIYFSVRDCFVNEEVVA